MAIDAAALIPPPLKLPRVHTHDDHVLGPALRGFGDVELKGRVAARMSAQELPVEPDLAVAEDALKLQLQDLALSGLGNGKALAIPGQLDRQVAVASIVGGIVVPGLIQHIIVRQMNRLPLRVIVAY